MVQDVDIMTWTAQLTPMLNAGGVFLWDKGIAEITGCKLHGGSTFVVLADSSTRPVVKVRAMVQPVHQMPAMMTQSCAGMHPGRDAACKRFIEACTG